VRGGGTVARGCLFKSDFSRNAAHRHRARRSSRTGETPTLPGIRDRGGGLGFRIRLARTSSAKAIRGPPDAVCFGTGFAAEGRSSLRFRRAFSRALSTRRRTPLALRCSKNVCAETRRGPRRARSPGHGYWPASFKSKELEAARFSRLFEQNLEVVAVALLRGRRGIDARGRDARGILARGAF